MAGNIFGKCFTITTFGESHGKAMGVVIDGCPAGLAISEEEIHQALKKRAPGGHRHTSPRKEKDVPEILSGVFKGITTGAPICILVRNEDSDSSVYEEAKSLLRPGHANYTYLAKYGLYDYRGAGRASARETLCRVAAGAVARKILAHYEITCFAHLVQIGEIKAQAIDPMYEGEIFCKDPEAEKKMLSFLDVLQEEGDSIGGVVAFSAKAPAGLGEPVYDKMEARLAHAMLSIPASKGFEIGSGFEGAKMRGSLHNDPFMYDGEFKTEKNDAGGILGGISSGMMIEGKVAFKPTSSIKIPQKTVTTEGQSGQISYTGRSRHDPCVAIRAVPVVEAMVALVLVDLLLENKGAKI